MLNDPTFWVGISFAIFVGLIFYFKAPSMIAKALDERAETITREINEAKKLREEAQALHAEYQRRHRDAEDEAREIITQAESEAERLAAETKIKLDEMLARRTAQVESKIAMAEEQAIDEVRMAAASAAIAAAEKVIGESLTQDKSAALIDKSIAELKNKLN